MLRGSTVKGLLPVHLKPKDGELLSSWLARLASGHGLAPNTFCSLIWSSYRLPGDIDLIDDPKILKILSKGTGTPMKRVVATTLSAYRDRLYDPDDERRPWIMPVDDVPRNLAFGLQFCPQCLSDDKEPYFRFRWRLAFVTICERHLTPLMDSCSQCGACIANLTKRNTSRPIQMLSCPSCKTDLRTAIFDPTTCGVDSADVKFQECLVGAVHQGWTEIPGNDPVHSSLYFKVLYTLVNLLSVSMFAESLRAQISRHFNISQVTVSLPQRDPSFERLRIDDRRGVLGITRHMLED